MTDNNVQKDSQLLSSNELSSEDIKVLKKFSEALSRKFDKDQKKEEFLDKIKENGGIVEKDPKTGKCKIIPNNLYNQELKDKKVAYTSAQWNVAYQSALERDKQILSLSALTIGGLLVFLQAGFRTELSFIFWIISILSFLIVLFLSLEVLRNNCVELHVLLERKIFLEHLCDKCRKYRESSSIEHLSEKNNSVEKWAYRLFVIGVIFTILFALYQSGISIQLPEKNRNNTSYQTEQTTQ